MQVLWHLLTVNGLEEKIVKPLPILTTFFILPVFFIAQIYAKVVDRFRNNSSDVLYYFFIFLKFFF